jgi:CheY-like chemotaxis protein
MTPVLRILYVEDNPLVREVTAELLLQETRQVVSVETAEEALLEFHANPYDMVITDVSLPVMSGLDLARNLLHIRPTLPIIVASGYPMDFGMLHLGPNVRSVIKPFDAADIDALIGELSQAQN